MAVLGVSMIAAGAGRAGTMTGGVPEAGAGALTGGTMQVRRGLARTAACACLQGRGGGGACRLIWAGGWYDVVWRDVFGHARSAEHCDVCPMRRAGGSRRSRSRTPPGRLQDRHRR
jgi:hypothetical protein